MRSLKKLLTLIEKDLFEFFSSKSWIVVLVLPLLVTFLYTVVYRQAETKTFTVACSSTINHSIQRIFTSPQLRLKIYHDLNLAKKDLATAKIDGVILNTPNVSGPIMLLVDKTRAGEAALVADAINSALVRTYATPNIPLIKLVYLNQSISTRWISLPIWLIQIILTICLLQAAASIADEKDRQTIHSLLVSPMTITDYMFSKLLWNAFIGTGSILLTLLLIGAAINTWAVILFAVLGCLIFSAASILIGLISPSTLFARTVATLTYIFSALPMMIQDLSFNWKFLLNLFPSNLIFYGLDKRYFLTLLMPFFIYRRLVFPWRPSFYLVLLISF